MKLPANVQADWKMAAVLIGGAVVLYYLAKREVVQAATAAGQAVNITSRDNLAYRATSAIVAGTAGAEQGGPRNLGEWFYSKTDPDGWALLKGIRK